MFSLTCTVVRVGSGTGRFTRTLLAKPVKWAPIGDTEVDAELPPLHAFVALRDTDVMASADPRIRYTLRVEQTAGATPWPLGGKERDRQIAPPGKRTIGEATGRATVYTVVQVLALTGLPGPDEPVTVKMVAACLSPAGRSAFAQYFTLTGPPAVRPVQSPHGMLTMLTRVRGISPAQRLLVLDTLGDAWAPAAYTAMTALSLARPSSLSRLSAGELASLTRWLAGPAITGLLQQPAPAGGTAVTPGDLVHIVDCLPLQVCSVHTDLLPCTPGHARPAAGLFRALAAMRASASTVGRVRPADGDTGEPVPAWAVQVGAIVPLADEAPGTFTTGRWLDLRQQAVRTLHHEFDRVQVLCTPPGRGGPGAAALYADRLPGFMRLLLAARPGSDAAGEQQTWYVAPTPGHAADLERCGLACLSVQDVLAGRVPRRGPLAQPVAVCLVYAHGFGLRTWTAVTGLLAPLLTRRQDRVLVMAGDQLSWGGEGSPHPCDAGAVFRDVCGAIRRKGLPHGQLERISEAAEHWTAPLYAWPEPGLPDGGDGLVVQAASEGRPDCDLPLVAVRGWRPARTHWAAYERMFRAERGPGMSAAVAGQPWWAVDKWLAVPELGAVGTAWQTGLRTEPGQRLAGDRAPTKPLALRTRQGLVVWAGQDADLDHRACCRTDTPNTMDLEMHPGLRTLMAGTPVRALARWSPRPVAKRVLVVVPEDDDAVALQDVRAACTLATECVQFVTVSGTRQPLVDAVARQTGRARTGLLDLLLLPAPAAPTTGTAGSPVLPPAMPVPLAGPPFVAHVLGTTDTMDLIESGIGHTDDGTSFTTAAACRRHMDAWLRADPGQAAVPPPPPQPPASPGPAVPRPFAPVSGALLGAMSQLEIDQHVNGRFAALQAVYPLPGGGGSASSSSTEYPPNDAWMEQMAVRVGGPRRTRHDREAAAVHVLCLAVKGMAAPEAWLLAAERRLFGQRMLATGMDAGRMLATLGPTDQQTLGPTLADQVPDAAAKALGTIHQARVQQYLTQWVPVPPPNNPIEDEDLPGHAFFDKLLVLRTTLSAMAGPDDRVPDPAKSAQGPGQQ